MSFRSRRTSKPKFRREHRSHNHHIEQRAEEPDLTEPGDPRTTGAETGYLKSLVDSRTKVTVVLTTGEKLRGRIRYYDRDCFSLGPAGRGPNIFLRKSRVHSIIEE